MSEAAILDVVSRIAVAVLGPAIEAALSGGEPEEAVTARLSALHKLVVRDTAAEDRSRRAKLEAMAAAVSRVSIADVDSARNLASSHTLSKEERASVLRLVAHTQLILGHGIEEDDGS